MTADKGPSGPTRGHNYCGECGHLKIAALRLCSACLDTEARIERRIQEYAAPFENANPIRKLMLAEGARVYPQQEE